MSKADLLALENAADNHAASLSVFTLPIRAPYSGLAAIVSALQHGPRPRPLAASNWASRLSYLASLLARCPSEPTGSSTVEALEAYYQTDYDRSQTRFLVAYAHFSELMPEVHRDYYDVRTTGRGFRLEHRSKAFADDEARDIILSELALPFMDLVSSAMPIRRALLEAGLAARDFGVRLSGAVAGNLLLLTYFYEQSACEISLMGDSGYVAVIGTGQRAFSRLQAAIFAFGDYASILGDRLAAMGGEDNVAEALEWRTLCWRENPLLGLLQALGHGALTSRDIDSILELFSIDFRKTRPDVSHAGDGFFPPIVLVPGAVLVNTDLMRMTFQSRNLLYALNRRDRTTFDNVVSSKLEPHLLEQCAAVLQALPGVQVGRNVRWTNGDIRGEIDLLAYDKQANVAVHAQAKAAMPPHGARLVQRLEGRVEEGLEQLRRFRESGAPVIDRTVATAFGVPVTAVELVDVVLVRTSIGTGRVREGVSDVAFITLALLALVARTALDRGTRTRLRDVIADTQAYLEDLVGRAMPAWRSEELTILDKVLEVPMFQYDETLIDIERRAAYNAQRSFGIS